MYGNKKYTPEQKQAYDRRDQTRFFMLIHKFTDDEIGAFLDSISGSKGVGNFFIVKKNGEKVKFGSKISDKWNYTYLSAFKKAFKRDNSLPFSDVLRTTLPAITFHEEEYTLNGQLFLDFKDYYPVNNHREHNAYYFKYYIAEGLSTQKHLDDNRREFLDHQDSDLHIEILEQVLDNLKKSLESMKNRKKLFSDKNFDTLRAYIKLVKDKIQTLKGDAPMTNTKKGNKKNQNIINRVKNSLRKNPAATERKLEEYVDAYFKVLVDSHGAYCHRSQDQIISLLEEDSRNQVENLINDLCEFCYKAEGKTFIPVNYEACRGSGNNLIKDILVEAYMNNCVPTYVYDNDLFHVGKINVNKINGGKKSKSEHKITWNIENLRDFTESFYTSRPVKSTKPAVKKSTNVDGFNQIDQIAKLATQTSPAVVTADQIAKQYIKEEVEKKIGQKLTDERFEELYAKIG